MTSAEAATTVPTTRTPTRLIGGIVIALAAIGAAIAAVLVLAEHSSIGVDPDGSKLAVEFTIAFAVALGWALGGAFEGWIRGDSPDSWFEALFYRTFVGAMVLFGLVVAGVIALERAGVGPASGL